MSTTLPQKLNSEPRHSKDKDFLSQFLPCLNHSPSHVLGAYLPSGLGTGQAFLTHPLCWYGGAEGMGLETVLPGVSLVCPSRAFSVPLGQGHCFRSGAWHSSFLELCPGWLHNPVLTRPASGSDCLASEVTHHLPPISPEENSMTLKKKKVMGHLISQNGLAKKQVFWTLDCTSILLPLKRIQDFLLGAHRRGQRNGEMLLPTLIWDGLSNTPTPHPPSSQDGAQRSTNYQSPERKEGPEGRALEPGQAPAHPHRDGLRGHFLLLGSRMTKLIL